jgi:hypothetical protein
LTDLNSLQNWLKSYIEGDFNYLDNMDIMSVIYNKNWSTSIPPYDPDELGNDLEVEQEYLTSKMNFKFNEHGIGFNEFGEETFEMKMNSNLNFDLKNDNYDSYKKHEEL